MRDVLFHPLGITLLAGSALLAGGLRFLEFLPFVGEFSAMAPGVLFLGASGYTALVVALLWPELESSLPYSQVEAPRGLRALRRTRLPAPVRGVRARAPGRLHWGKFLPEPLVREMGDLLNLQPGLKKYIIHAKTNSVQKGSLELRTRSILGILAYLSQGVEIPPIEERLKRMKKEMGFND